MHGSSKRDNTSSLFPGTAYFEKCTAILKGMIRVATWVLYLPVLLYHGAWVLCQNKAPTSFAPNESTIHTWSRIIGLLRAMEVNTPPGPQCRDSRYLSAFYDSRSETPKHCDCCRSSHQQTSLENCLLVKASYQIAAPKLPPTHDSRKLPARQSEPPKQVL